MSKKGYLFVLSFLILLWALSFGVARWNIAKVERQNQKIETALMSLPAEKFSEAEHEMILQKLKLMKEKFYQWDQNGDIYPPLNPHLLKELAERNNLTIEEYRFSLNEQNVVREISLTVKGPIRRILLFLEKRKERHPQLGAKNISLYRRGEDFFLKGRRLSIGQRLLILVEYLPPRQKFHPPRLVSAFLEDAASGRGARGACRTMIENGYPGQKPP